MRHLYQLDLRIAARHEVDGPVTDGAALPFAEPVLPEHGERFVGRVLPADDDAQQFWSTRTLDQVEQGGNQLRITVAGYLNKNRVFHGFGLGAAFERLIEQAIT